MIVGILSQNVIVIYVFVFLQKCFGGEISSEIIFSLVKNQFSISPATLCH